MINEPTTGYPQIITPNGGKGGPGRTKVIFNISGILADTDPVLLIDTDPECHLSFNVGVDVTEPGLKTVRDVFEGSVRAEEVICKSPIKRLPKLDLIPSSTVLEEIEIRLVTKVAREQILKNFILDNWAVFSKYKYIFIDHNSSNSIINKNAYFAADSIIIITDVSNNTIRGAENFFAQWEYTRSQLRKPDNIKALIVNNYDKRLGIAPELLEFCRTHEEFGKLLINTVIPYSVRIKETEFGTVPVNLMPFAFKQRAVFKDVIKDLKGKGVL